MSSVNNILYLIQQAGTLMQTYRSHQRTLHTSFDTIASHSYLVIVISYCISRNENLTHEESMRVVTMAMVHDLPEARTGDLDFISKNYVKSDEKKAVLNQLGKLSFGKDLIGLFNEYEKRVSKEAQIVRDADSLAQMYHEWVLTWHGNKLAEKWFEGDFSERVPFFFTKTAKELAYAMKNSNPNEWWWIELVRKKGGVKTKEHLLGKNYLKKKERKY